MRRAESQVRWGLTLIAVTLVAGWANAHSARAHEIHIRVPAVRHMTTETTYPGGMTWSELHAEVMPGPFTYHA